MLYCSSSVRNTHCTHELWVWLTGKAGPEEAAAAAHGVPREIYWYVHGRAMGAFGRRAEQPWGNPVGVSPRQERRNGASEGTCLTMHFARKAVPHVWQSPLVVFVPLAYGLPPPNHHFWKHDSSDCPLAGKNIYFVGKECRNRH